MTSRFWGSGGAAFAFSHGFALAPSVLTAGTLAFDSANGWVTGQNPPALAVGLPSDGSVQVGDWYCIAYGSSSSLTGATYAPWQQITSDMVLNDTVGETYAWGVTLLPSGLTYFACQFGRGVDATHITLTSPLSNIINDTIAAWSPALLFASGEQGYVFDPSSTANFFQDSAGTTAGAFGSPIGLLKDVYSGGAKDFSQATSTKRPTAVSPGWVSFDGSTNILSRASVSLFASATGCSIVMAVNAAAQGATKVWWGEDSTSSDSPGYRPGTQTNSATPVLIYANDAGSIPLNTDTLITLFDSAAHILSITDTVASGNGSIAVWKDRTAASTNPVSYTRSGTATLNVSSLGALKRTTEIVNYAGEIGRAIFINRPLTSGERASAEAWCASPYGITLP